MRHSTSDQEPCGILNVHKPPGVTSRDVVNQVQRSFGRKIKIGHAGTLDPMATGVLLIAVGRATRLISVIHEYSKSYVAGFTLGQTSDTDDATGQIEVQVNLDTNLDNDLDKVQPPPTRSQVLAALQTQVGRLMQLPPAFSAVKVSGQRAYKLARQGEQVKIEPREVTVHSLELLAYGFPHLSIEVCCGSGTYIRSIARDVGEILKVGGLMHELQRTRIGPFRIEGSVVPEQIEPASLAPVESVFDSAEHHKHILSEAEIQLLRNGHRLEIPNVDSGIEKLVALTAEGQFAARLARCEADNFRGEINWVPQWFASH